MSKAEWESAAPPNYDTNVDLKFPYSDMPYDPFHHLVKIPARGQLIEHVDYWGEGRIVTDKGVSGFIQSYNVNRQYQCVSNGINRHRKIPNRIPVADENHCDTSRYVEDDSVRNVTVMGAPIIRKCAHDITRMINGTNGKVFAYGFSDDSDYIKNLKDELKKKGIFYCYAYPLPESFKGMTLFQIHHAFLNTTELNDELYFSVTGGDYARAVKIFKTLEESGGDNVSSYVVNKIMNQGIKHTTTLAYHLWNNGARGIVIKYFPYEYKLIFNEDEVKITSRYFGLSLKLDVNTDENFRLAWGDGSDKSIQRLKWKIIPELRGATVVFKILNLQYNMYLLLAVAPDEDYGDRRAWGTTLTGEVRFRWYFNPKKINNQVVFLIENYEYKQGLKLDSNTDSGDRGLWGHNGNVADSPGYYGFLVEEL